MNRYSFFLPPKVFICQVIAFYWVIQALMNDLRLSSSCFRTEFDFGRIDGLQILLLLSLFLGFGAADLWLSSREKGGFLG